MRAGWLTLVVVIASATHADARLGAPQDRPDVLLGVRDGGALVFTQRTYRFPSSKGDVEVTACSASLLESGNEWRLDPVRVIDGVAQLEWSTPEKLETPLQRSIGKQLATTKTCDEALAALRTLKWQSPKRERKQVDLDAVSAHFDRFEQRHWEGIKRAVAYGGINDATILVAGFRKGATVPDRWTLVERSTIE